MIKKISPNAIKLIKCFTDNHNNSTKNYEGWNSSDTHCVNYVNDFMQCEYENYDILQEMFNHGELNEQTNYEQSQINNQKDIILNNVNFPDMSGFKYTTKVSTSKQKSFKALFDNA